MNRNTLRTATSIGLTAILAAGAVLVSPIAASAAGVGDVSDAVLYGVDGPIGSVLTDLSNSDDDSTTVTAPFAINFFGVRSEGLCITTNGVIAPVVNDTDGCGSNYDVDLANYATEEDESVIGALLADLDPSEDLAVAPATTLAIASIAVSGEMITFTTVGTHPFAVGEEVSLEFSPDHPIFGNGFNDPIYSVPAANQFVIDGTGSGIPDSPDTAYTGTATGEPTYYEDTNSDGFADDGFGNVKQIYAGATIVDGKPAFAVTWYRVPTNDDENSELLSNTFQLVIIQEPTADPSNGYDFSVQFNFGTLTDGNDGYEVGSGGNESCDSEQPETCAWSVGWVRWDSGTDTAEEFEFFADVPVTDLIDGAGNSALVNNRLNSDVYGRYVMSMFGGVTTGYAVPVLDGRDVETAALPNTGTDATPLIAASLLLLVAGGALLLAVRRRQES